MPKTSKSGKPIKDELPTPVQRSDEHARATFAKTYDSAMEQYDDEGRANATTGRRRTSPARRTTVPRRAA